MSAWRRGMSLAELLIAMALLTLLLGSMAALFSVGVRTTTRSNVATENVNMARLVMQTVLNEVRQAQLIHDPAPGVAATQVAFRRPHPDGGAADFNVRYKVIGGVLYRKTWVSPSEPADDDANLLALYGGVVSATFTVAAGAPPEVAMRVTVDTTSTDGTPSSVAAALSGRAMPRVLP